MREIIPFERQRGTRNQLILCSPKQKAGQLGRRREQRVLTGRESSTAAGRDNNLYVGCRFTFAGDRCRVPATRCRGRGRCARVEALKSRRFPTTGCLWRNEVLSLVESRFSISHFPYSTSRSKKEICTRCKQMEGQEQNRNECFEEVELIRKALDFRIAIGPGLY